MGMEIQGYLWDTNGKSQGYLNDTNGKSRLKGRTFT